MMIGLAAMVAALVVFTGCDEPFIPADDPAPPPVTEQSPKPEQPDPPEQPQPPVDPPDDPPEPPDDPTEPEPEPPVPPVDPPQPPDDPPEPPEPAPEPEPEPEPEPPAPPDDPPEPEPEPVAPVVTGTIPDMHLTVGEDDVVVALTGKFRDPDNQALRYTVVSALETVVRARFHEGVVVTPVAAGMAAVTVFATDEDGLTASLRFYVTVKPAPPQVKGDPRCPYPAWRQAVPNGPVLPVEQLLSQVSTEGALCVTAPASVSKEAIRRVAELTTTMTRHRPDLLASMTGDRYGVIVVLLEPHAANLCESEVGVRFPKVGGNPCTRGYAGGGITVCPSVAHEMDVCAHEIGHDISLALHLIGDPDRKRIRSHFTGSTELCGSGDLPPCLPSVAIRRLWSGYALTNPGEFFAEMTSIYFGYGGEGTRPLLYGAEPLRRHDPATYDLLNSVYWKPQLRVGGPQSIRSTTFSPMS